MPDTSTSKFLLELHHYPHQLDSWLSVVVLTNLFLYFFQLHYPLLEMSVAFQDEVGTSALGDSHAFGAKIGKLWQSLGSKGR